MNQNKSAQIFVRCTPELKARVELLLAEDDELSLAGLCRLLLKSWVKQQTNE